MRRDRAGHERSGRGASSSPADAPAPSPLRFGRMFSSLPAFQPPDVLVSDTLASALRDIGRPGGVLDAGDDLAAGPLALVLDPALNVNNPNNPTHTAGTTFVGQFLDHDITFDASSLLGVPTEPGASPNARTPSLDLDSVYGAGPTASPLLYDADDPCTLRVESGGRFEDLPRDSEGRAVLADPRNDETIMVAGLQCAVMLFHNRAVGDVRSRGVTDAARVFAEARRLTTWHYQWMVVHEFLPQFVGPAMVEEVRARGRRHFRPPRAGSFIPVEFSGACYRFGHAMARPSYRANFTGNAGEPFLGLLFDPAAEAAKPADPDDMVGGCRAARRYVGWHTFFDFGDDNAKPNKRINRHLSTPLFDLPLSAIVSHDPPTALAQRTLLRHVTWSLPSGQEVARALGVDPLPAERFPELVDYGLGLEASTPLWYYTLAEAEILEDGLHLGPVGGRVVAEVILGLLEADPDSYLAAQPAWTPSVERAYSSDGGFRMTDFLAYARVDAMR